MKLNFKNIGDANKRLKIVPTNGATITKVNVTNPTFGLDTNNVATFCLTSKPEISCYGATLNVFIAAKHLESETDIPDTTMATVEVYDRGTVEIDFDSSITDINNELAKVGLFAYAIPGGLLEVVNDLQTAARVIVTAINGASMKIDIDNPNPTADFINEQSIYFCLTEKQEQGKVYDLKLDDKGLHPSDNIYSGTITPPNTDLKLVFQIQWYDVQTQDGNNGRVTLVSDYINISSDGSTWSVDVNTLPSSKKPQFGYPSGYMEVSIFQNQGLNDPSFVINEDKILYPHTAV